MLLSQFKNEIRLILKKPAEIVQPVIFGLITITLFVLAIGTSKSILASVAPAVIWVIALLAILLSTDRLFIADHEDGSLEQQQLAACPFFLLISIKLLVHWLLVVLPLIVVCPLYAALLYAGNHNLVILALTLILGTPAVMAFSALGSALVLSLKRGSLLLGMIVTPLYVPVLIFAMSAIQAHREGLDASAHLALLLALTLLSLLVCLPAICGALKLNN